MIVDVFISLVFTFWESLMSSIIPLSPNYDFSFIQSVWKYAYIILGSDLSGAIVASIMFWFVVKTVIGLGLFVYRLIPLCG